jgi:hypothetical protein
VVVVNAEVGFQVIRTLPAAVLARTLPMSLSCGGRGPCCHIGYSHRHCEHCDTVIPVSAVPHTHYPNYYPYYGVSGIYNGNLNSQLSPFTNQSQSVFQQLGLSQPVTEIPIDAGE